MSLVQLTGLVLIIVPIAFNVVFFALSQAFEYPDILRKPTGYILEKFSAGGTRLIALWYAFAFTALLAIPMALLLGAVLREEQPELANAATFFGVLSGLVQALGLLRWSFLVPSLAMSYKAATSTKRDAIETVFNAFHQYMGVAVGEHLGYVFTGTWSILIAIIMLDSELFSAWLSIPGILSALGIMVGVFEASGWKRAGTINAISYIVWSLWLVSAGIMLMTA